MTSESIMMNDTFLNLYFETTHTYCVPDGTEHDGQIIIYPDVVPDGTLVNQNL